MSQNKCICEECEISESACSGDCDVESECLGCRESRFELQGIKFDIAVAVGDV